MTGVILAGGDSRRMGRDKAFLTHGGRTLLEIVRDVLAPLCQEVLVVAPQEKLAKFSGVAGVGLVADAHPRRGPLVGVRAGLAAARHPLIFVAACDMPSLGSAGVDLCLAADPAYEVVVPRIGGRYQPLHARYGIGCLPAIDRALARGVPPVSSFYGEVNILEIGEAEFRAVDPCLAGLANLNTPGQWSSCFRPGD